ncbi:GNAT family N-acetyltransferase [Allonocardiopsis opalescens]|uniref:RimJ/RimL family protein N-acetyltransferase n=1 Tax=Allonocardiopsis opalescens TaxID=1144618 RepID=A0A2T0Q9Z0_9ACTN|nr:GNAT family protein [Allonocardiopsis opalescens]PRY00655.1 RimJ/RimL family protein N-acetyltransferase [Allonocardiopsis opalescens]
MAHRLPPWPAVPPAHGSVVLRAFTDHDVHLAVELATDPYVPLIGSLPANPTKRQALAWTRRQRRRHSQGVGFSFAIADAESGTAVGAIGLWPGNPPGRATAGYSVSPAHRGRGAARDALAALTAFAWSLPTLRRVELYIEPWNEASIRVAEACGYLREGLLHGHQEIGGVRRNMLVFAAERP